MESAKTWRDRLSEGWPASQSTKRNVPIKYTEAGRRDVSEICRTHDDKYKWRWKQVTNDISLLGRAIGRNRVEVVKQFMETPGINKSKCGIRKMPHEPHYAMLADGRNTRYAGHAHSNTTSNDLRRTSMRRQL